jgi:dipeptidyl aminopeptidase/acylaminoacyl peptidase
MVSALAAVGWAAGLQTPALAGAQDNSSVSAVVVHARETPAVQGAPPPLEDYARLPEFSQIALSQDGTQVAFVANIKGVRLLIAYRFADKTRRIVKLGGGDISATSWVDPDHVLLIAERPASRGTCNAEDQALLVGDVLASDAAVDSAKDGIAASAARSGAAGQELSADSQELRTRLLNQTVQYTPPCIYYGARARTAETLINVAHATGLGLGDFFSDVHNLPLGEPQLVSVQGALRLVGPYLELRKRAFDDQPVQRVYPWSVDVRTGQSKLLDDKGGDIERVDRYADDWLFDPQGGFLARGVYDYASKTFTVQMWTKGAWRLALVRKIDPKAHTFAPFIVGRGRDEPSIILIDAAEDAGTGDRRFHYYQLSPDGALSGPLEPDDAARDKPIFDRASGRLVGFVTRGDAESYRLDTPDLQAIFDHAQDAVPGETVRVVATADDPRKLIIQAEGRGDPGAYYFLDFATGANQTIGEDYGDIPSAWIAPQSTFHYRAEDGLDITGLLTLPPAGAAKGLPLIVLPHDGLQAHDRLGFDWMAQALASRGYLVLQPNARGSDGYGEAHLAAGYGQLGRKIETDIADGASALVAQGLADPRRVCIAGVGWGGYAALVAAETKASPYRCAIAVNGVSDLAAYRASRKANLALADQDRITPLIPDPQTPRAFVADPQSLSILSRYEGSEGAAPSPIANAGSASIPILLLHEDRDPQSPFQQSQSLDHALKVQYKSVEFVALKGDDHDLMSETTRLAALKAMLDFLARSIPAGPGSP